MNNNIFVPFFPGYSELMLLESGGANIIEKVFLNTNNIQAKTCELKNIKYKDSKKKYNKCPISLINFKDNYNIIELPCEHCFIYNYIMKWLTIKYECPVCREKIITKETSAQVINKYIEHLMKKEEKQLQELVYYGMSR